MNTLQRHQLVYTFLQPALKLFTKLWFNYQYDDLSQIEGPYLLLPNHNLELDPIVIGVSTKKQIYFVASEHLMRKGFATKLLNYFFKPIIHQKGQMGVHTVAQMLKTLRSGSSVCVFPEGNRSFNGLTQQFSPVIGKLARKAGVKVITYRLEGGYLTNPRWSLSIRRGKLRGRLIHVYEPQELKTMTNEAVYQAIQNDLSEDAYATQSREMIPFRGKKLALGMESTIFRCPLCGKIGTLRSDNDSIRCDCGFCAAYDVYGYLKDQNGTTYTVTQLDAMQQQALQQLAQSDSEQPLFHDEVLLQTIGQDHMIQQEQCGTLTAYTDRLECCGIVMPMAEIGGAAIYSRNVLVLYAGADNQHYEIRGEQMFSALKYLYLYQIKQK